MSKMKDITLNEVGDLVQHVIKHMATKEDLAREINYVRAEMTKGFSEIRADIAYI